MPLGAKVKPTVDVDGDGRPDSVWIGPPDGPASARFGIETATGKVAGAPFESAAPIYPSVLALKLNANGPALIVVFDRVAYLFAYIGCSIVPITGVDGQPFWLSLGWGNGTGAACVDVNGTGHRDLVELFNLRGSNDGTGPVPWKETVVRIDGAHASVGQTIEGTYQLPRDQKQVENLSAFKCGDLTDTDAVTAEPGH